ncbi:MAG TPA: NAD-dependent deacylase [Vicinamibacteria bacterium]|nr:NAD-dependent deacylase [Vicinamibacteria bacterium]
MRLGLDGDTHLLVLTGAGVSAESGVPTFRDASGLWEQHPIEQVATPQGFAADPGLVWRFYSQRRRKARDVSPNPGHLALAEAEERMGERFLLVTQNVDGLHQRAGSRRVVEMHGSLFETRCASCDRPAFPDREEHGAESGGLPTCDECAAAGRQGLLRPAVVWFGEMLDRARMREVEAFMERAAGAGQFVFLAVGTSGVVYPAAGLVLQARGYGAATWLVNVEPPENRGAFHHFVQGPSGRVLPELFEWS